MKATCFFFVLELLHPFPNGELFKRAVFSHVYGRDTCLAVGIPPVGLWRITVYRFCLADSCPIGNFHCICIGMVTARLAVSGACDAAALVRAVSGPSQKVLSP